MDLSTLNPQQKQVVEQHSGPVLVLAGAGTGKTTVVTYRIASMLNKGIKPSQILAVTFTNKAAAEMKVRMRRLLSSANADELTVSTFHSFCCQLLHKHIQHFGYTAKFGIADDGDQTDIIKQIIGDMNIANAQLDLAFFRNGISDAKNHMKDAEGIRGSGRMIWFETLADVFDKYQERLKQMNLVDFDDLLLLAVRLFQEREDILKSYQDRFRYLLVDEFQDTNVVQAELVRLLAGKSRNVCVVGDDDQSIYGWRGAAVSNILDFPQSYPGAKVIKLEENYRSTNNILRAANHIIANNQKRHGKSLWSAAGDGDELRVFEAENENEEARLVARMAQHYHVEKQLAYDEMSLLFRSNSQSRQFEQAFREKNIPYRIIGAKSFYDRREVKDAAAYLRIVHNPWDDLSLLRILNVPPRGIGNRTVEKLLLRRQHSSKPLTNLLAQEEFQNAVPPAAKESICEFLRQYQHAVKEFSEAGDLAHKIHHYLKDMGYINGLKQIYRDHRDALARAENIQELINSAYQFEERPGNTATLGEFLEASALLDSSDNVDDKTEEGHGITLMTVHAAKGLEFSWVCLVGIEQKLFPHERSLRDGDLDEERRLFYVALTRAKRHLLITRAKSRTRHGQRMQQVKSQFLRELPEELLVFNDLDAVFKPPSREETQDILSALKARYSD